MIEDRDQGQAGTDPEGRAFAGKPDMPPSQPDQPETGNEELKRPGGEPGGEGEDRKDGHGDYGELPGYGG